MLGPAGRSRGRRGRGRRRPDRREARPRPLPAAQAGRRHHARRRTRRAGRRWSTSCPPSPACSRSVVSTATRRACSCSPTTATSPIASPIRASAWTRSTSSRWTGDPSRGALARLRDGVELEDGMHRAGQGRPARRSPAAHHDPRGSQPAGAADVRGGRPSGGPPRPHSHRPPHRPIAQARGVADPHPGRGAGARACGCREGPQVTSTLVPAALRALRGATTVDEDEESHVHERVITLLEAMCARNGVDHDDIVSILFTATDDLHATFPATGARKMGLGDVPLICARELDVDGRYASVHPGADAPHHRAQLEPSCATSTSKAPSAFATTCPGDVAASGQRSSAPG